MKKNDRLKAYKEANEHLKAANKELDKAEDAIEKIDAPTANAINAIGLKICKVGIAMCTVLAGLEKE